MKIYLDDNIDSDCLIGILRANGFTVISPRDIGMRHKPDIDHLRCAIVVISQTSTRKFDNTLA